MQIHESAEDYLETILRLSKRQGQVRSIDIVNELGYSKPSVSVAMKRLRENGYITMDEEGFITLNPSGEETAAADACKIEHDLSDETFEKITEHALHYMQVEPPDFSR